MHGDSIRKCNIAMSNLGLSFFCFVTIDVKQRNYNMYLLNLHLDLKLYNNDTLDLKLLKLSYLNPKLIY